MSILRSNWFTVILTLSHFWHTSMHAHTMWNQLQYLYTSVTYIVNYFTFYSNSKLRSQRLIIQHTFLGISVTGNSIQHAVTYVHFSQFIANITHSTNSTIMLQGSDSTQPVAVYSNNRHSGFELHWHCITSNDNDAKGKVIWHKTESIIFTSILSSSIFYRVSFVHMFINTTFHAVYQYTSRTSPGLKAQLVP